MKIIKIGIVLVIVFAVVLWGILSYGLNPAVQKVLPLVSEQLKTKVTLGSISLNLLAGSISLKELKVANPEGFEEPYLFTLAKNAEDIGLMDLITKRQIKIEEIAVEESNLTVVRSKAGEINIKKLMDALNKGQKPAQKQPSAAEEKPKTSGSQTIPPVMLDKFLFTTGLFYIDHKISAEPFNIGLYMKTEAANIATFGPQELSGTFKITGNLAGNKDLFKIDINGRTAPVVDPLKPTFEMSGTVNAIDFKLFSSFSSSTGINGGIMNTEISMACDKGVFNPQKSAVKIVIDKVEYTKETAAKFPKEITPPSTLTMNVPVSGTIMEPQIDIAGAITGAMLSALSPSNLAKSQLQGKAQELLKSEKLEKSGLGGILGSTGLLGDKTQPASAQQPAEQGATTEAAASEPAAAQKSGLESALGAITQKADQTAAAEQAAPQSSAQTAETKKESAIGGLLGGLGGKKDAAKEGEKKKLPFGF